MKKLSQLKLNNIDFQNLESREMKEINGGYIVCRCGCCYEGDGGSSTLDNGEANANAGLKSPCDGEYFLPTVSVTPESNET